MWPFKKRTKPSYPRNYGANRNTETKVQTFDEMMKANRRELMRTTLQKAVVFFKVNFPKATIHVTSNPLTNELPPLTLPVVVYLSTMFNIVSVEIQDPEKGYPIASYSLGDYTALEVCAMAAGYTGEDTQEDNDAMTVLITDELG